MKEKIRKAIEAAWAWLKESNRYKHVAVGVVIGALSGDMHTAVYASAAAGAAAEYKDRAHGDKWDFVDLLCTVAGGILGGLVWV